MGRCGHSYSDRAACPSGRWGGGRPTLLVTDQISTAGLFAGGQTGSRCADVGAALRPRCYTIEPMRGVPTRLAGRARKLRRDLRFLVQLRVLPPMVALFQWRAGRLASKMNDEFGPVSASRPPKLAALLSLAKNRHYVVELGTATGWTAISLLIADPRREVVSYDPFERPEPHLYLDLAGPSVRDRLTLVLARGDEGPKVDRPVDLLYIDTTHGRADTIRELEAWRPVLKAGAVVVFDDFTHPEFPGVREAVQQLGLKGEEREGLFVHRIRGGSTHALETQ
jgi:Methyltransferase domain